MFTVFDVCTITALVPKDVIVTVYAGSDFWQAYPVTQQSAAARVRQLDDVIPDIDIIWADKRAVRQPWIANLNTGIRHVIKGIVIYVDPVRVSDLDSLPFAAPLVATNASSAIE
jgi:hypothetical protein